MRAALYIRVSTEEQASEGFSLDAQRRILEDYCIVQDLDPVGPYVDDGYSGRNTNRPAYRRMMDEIDLWDKILVIKMDRIHRNSRNFMDMMERLEHNGKRFESTSESLDTENAMGRFVVDMIQRIAQLESEHSKDILSLTLSLSQVTVSRFSQSAVLISSSSRSSLIFSYPRAQKFTALAPSKFASPKSPI